MRVASSFFACLVLALALAAHPAFAAKVTPHSATPSVEAHDSNQNESHKGDSPKQGLPQFDTTKFPSQIFWLVVTFGFAYGLMRYVALPQVESTLAKREKKIEHDIEQARAINVEAKKLMAEYETRLSHARTQSQETYAKTLEENAQKSAQRLSEQQKSIEDQLTQAEKRIQAAKTTVLANLNTETEQLVSIMVQKIANVTPDAQSVQAAIRKARGG